MNAQVLWVARANFFLRQSLLINALASSGERHSPPETAYFEPRSEIIPSNICMGWERPLADSLPHRHQFFRARRVNCNGVIEVLLCRSHTYRDCETLHHLG